MSKLATIDLEIIAYEEQLAALEKWMQIRSETVHKILIAWADWVDRDDRLIQRSHGAKSQVGELMRGNIQQVETTETARAVRAREMFSEQVYHKVEIARSKMTDHQREVLRRRYIYGWHHSKVAKKLFAVRFYRDPLMAYKALNQSIAEIHKIVDSELDWREVEIA